MSDDPARVLLPIPRAAIAAHVKERVVYQWIERGLLNARKDATGVLVVTELELLKVEAATRRQPRMRDLVAQALHLCNRHIHAGSSVTG